MIENLRTLSQKILYKRYFIPKISDLRHVLSLYNGSDWTKHIHASNNNIVNHGIYKKISFIIYYLLFIIYYLLKKRVRRNSRR